MTKNFGFDGQFVKKFMSNDRDFEEVQSLFEHVKNWEEKEISADISDILFNCLIIALEKFAYNLKF